MTAPGRTRRPPCPLEQAEHETLARYLETFQPHLLWLHIPNGGKRNPREAAKLKRMGVKRGAPDFVIFTAFAIESVGHVEWHPGLAIELKREHGSKTSEEQSAFLAAIGTNGWRAEVCHGADAAIKLIEECYGKGRRA